MDERDAVAAEAAGVLLVRHGRVHNPRQVAYGFLPRMGLADEGRAHTRHTAAYIASCRPPPVALYTSPLLRAVQTARILHAALPNLPVHHSWLLRESELARVWQGTPIADRPHRFPEEYRLFMEAPSRSVAGETMAGQAERMERVIRRALRRYPDGPLVFVSHRDPIVALRLRAEGRSFDDLHRTRCEPASVTELRVTPSAVQFERYVEPWPHTSGATPAR